MYFTEKQLRILNFIKEFRQERGISPTLEEIADNFGVTKITIYGHINTLVQKRALKRKAHCARSIELMVEVEMPKETCSFPVSGIISTSRMEQANGAKVEVPINKQRRSVYRIRCTGFEEHGFKPGDSIFVADRSPETGQLVLFKRKGVPDICKYEHHGALGRVDVIGVITDMHRSIG